jgi:hypothetical protein
MLNLLTDEITDEDLGALMEGFRALGQTGNRIGLDLFCIIEREMLKRHQGALVKDYSDEDLAAAVVMLTRCVDTSRAAGIPDDHPAVQFCLLAITSLSAEVEGRGLVQRLQ